MRPDKERVFRGEAPQAASRQFVGMNESPDWSPDGRYLAYVPRRDWYDPSGKARIVIREEESGGERILEPELAQIEQSRWSVDGREFVATGTDRNYRHGVFRINSRSGLASVVILGSGSGSSFHEPLWVNEDSVMYKVRDGGREPAPLIARSLSTGVEREISPSAYRIALSPDRSRLAYSSFDETSEFLRVVTLRDGTEVEVYREPREGRIVSVAWTQDSQRLLFAKRGKLWKIGVSTGRPEELPFAMEALRQLSVHPRGNKIAFTAGSTTRGEVWAMESIP